MKHTLQSLAQAGHPYYCSDSNYYSNDPGKVWHTMSDFLDEYESSDENMNLVFRWDVEEQDGGRFSASVFIMHQRKGIFAPHWVRSITEAEVDRFVAYLQRHFDLLMKLWVPLSPVL